MSLRQSSRGLVPIAVGISAICWLLWIYSLQSGDFVSEPIAETLLSFLGLRYSSLFTAVMGILTTLGGIWITRRFMLLGVRGQAIFFFLSALFLSTNPYFMIWEYFTPVLLLLSISFIPLFGAYNRCDDTLSLFDCGLLIGTSVLLWSPTLLLIPLYLLHMHTVRILSVRGIISLFLGTFTPLWIICPLLYVLGYESYLLLQWTHLTSLGFSLSHINSYDYTLLIGCLILPLVLLVLCCISSIHLSLSYWHEKVHSRTLYYSLTHTAFYFLGLSLIAGDEGIGFQYLSTFPIAILTARTLSQCKTKAFAVILCSLTFIFVGAFLLSLFL